MKNILTVLFTFFTLLAIGQVSVHDTVFVNTGSIFYTSQDVVVTTNGLLQVEGAVTIDGEVTGDSLVQIEPVGSLNLDNGTFTLENETDEAFTNLVLGQNGILEIPAGNSLTLNGDLNNQNTGVGIRLLADATGYSQLLVEGSQSGSGEVKKEYYLQGNTGWRNLASPVATDMEDLRNSGQDLYVGDLDSASVMWWDADTAYWKTPASESTLFERAKAYYVYAGDYNGFSYLTSLPNTIDLVGPLFDNTDLAVPLYYNDGQSTTVSFVGGTTLAATEGWNMIPNPYPCAYDWDGQVIPAGTDNSISVWNASSGVNGAYTYYVNGVGVNGGQRYIAPGQSFFVQTHNTSTPGTLTLSENQRNVDVHPVFYKTTSDGANMRLLVYTHSDSTNSDENYLEFSENATDKFDGEWDARKRMNGQGVPNLFYNLDKEYFSINRMDTFTDYKTVPLQFQCDVKGQYIIKPDLTHMPAEWTIELENTSSKTIYNLRDGTVEINHTDEKKATQFLLHINRYLNPDYMETGIEIYGFSNIVEVQFKGSISGEKEVKVFDLSGKLIAEKTVQEGIESAQIQMNLNTPKIFIVSVHSNNAIASEKVILHP